MINKYNWKGFLIAVNAFVVVEAVVHRKANTLS